jgi:hypothetical protein
VLASLVSENASHVLQATQVVQVGQTVSEPLQANSPSLLGIFQGGPLESSQGRRPRCQGDSTLQHCSHQGSSWQDNNGHCTYMMPTWHVAV